MAMLDVGSVLVSLLPLVCLICLVPETSGNPIPAQPQPPRVAFSAVRRFDMTTGGSVATITYDTVYTNVGGGFNRQSAHFVAPVSGYYFLAMSMMSHTTGSAFVRMKVNGRKIITAYGVARYGGDSNQVILHLNEGDNVWTELDSNKKIHSDRYNTFSGFLLWT